MSLMFNVDGCAYSMAGLWLSDMTTQNQSVLRYDTVTVGREVVNFSLTPPQIPHQRE